jgi:putative DNA primase/helicase
MNKTEGIALYNQQGYRTLEIPVNPDDPKALIRNGWNTEPTNINIGKDNLYAVIQENEKLVIDIDDPEFNGVLNEYIDKTLVVKTGNDGRHYYFKDILRLEKDRIKSTKLYKDGHIIGDIKAHMSYVIGCGSSYFDKKDNKTKTYTKISSVDTVLETDCYEILKILKNNGITIREENTSNERKFEDGLQVGERNNECFKTACNLFEKEGLDFESGLNFIKTWNRLSKKPLDDPEVYTVVRSAWNRIQNKGIIFDGEDKINNVATELQKNYKFVTLRETEEILLYNGKIYDSVQAETIIKEETERLIPNCTSHHRNEVVNKIKAQTYTNLEKFDVDPNLITLENGILNLETLELKPHTPEHLSRVLLPVEYNKPKSDNIEENLKETLFWKFLESSFTVDEKFRKEDFETVLEIIASPIVKRHIDERAFMFLGQGENGKSVCLGYVESIIGKNNVSSITLQDISDDKFMRANLAGKSANIFSDLEQNELRHTGKIKAITSNEGIEVQKKHQQGFTLYPFCKLMFSCNRFPKVYDQTQGFFRRWIIVKWDRNFENDPQRIEYLREKLASNQKEKNLVFSCLVEIANRLNKVGKFTHSKDWKVIQREWNANADPIDDFDTNYIKDSEIHKSKRETYQFYKEITRSKGESPLGMGQFSKAFAEYHDESREEINGKTQRCWLNIDFKIPQQTTLNEIDES